MPGDRLYEYTAGNSELLDTQVSGSKFQQELQNIREGLSQGFSSRVQQAQDNAFMTGVEVAGSFGVGAALATAAKVGGRWGVAADVVGKVMLAGMGADVFRRGYNVAEAYQSSSGNAYQDQLNRRDAIAQNFGTAAFDYPVMMLSGAAGAGAVHFGPKLSASLSTSLEGLRTPTMGMANPEMALIPVRANNFDVAALGRPDAISRSSMDIGGFGRLGVKELPAKSIDPLSAIRDRLDAPHKTARGLEELSALLEAKKIAGHPEVRPIYDEMSATLKQVDTIKPSLARDEQALAGFDKQIAQIKNLKDEIQAVRSAEALLTSAKADMEKLPGLTERQSALTAELSAARKAAEAQAKGGPKPDEPVADVGSIREELGRVKQDISDIRQRSQNLNQFEQNHASAQQALEARRKAIESGTDPEIIAIEKQMEPLKASVADKKGEIGALVGKLQELDARFVEKSLAVKPLVANSDANTIVDLPKYEKPRLDLEPTQRITPKRAAQTVEPAQAPKVMPETRVARGNEASNTNAEAIQRAANDRARSADRAQPQQTSPERKGSERNSERSNERARGNDRVAETRVTLKDVSNAHSEAKQAVDDFLKTSKRHTTALKKVNDYIDTAAKLMASDREFASKDTGTVLANVENLLSKLDNWERSPAWIRGAERQQLMKGQGIDAATMAKFDKWYESQNQIYYERASNGGGPEMKLAMIQEHLQRRVAVESVKNFLRSAGSIEQGISPVVNNGFKLMAEGKLPDGRPIPKGSDMIVFEQKTVRTPQGETQDVMVPFAKNGDKIQRFDDSKIAAGQQKFDTLKTEGPEGLPAKDLYALWLDHDPSRLLAIKPENQAGYAILRPGGAHGKNVLFMEFSKGIDSALIPRGLKADAPDGIGTNTGVLYNMLRNTLKPKS